MRADSIDRSDSQATGVTASPEIFFDQVVRAFESAERKMGGPFDHLFKIGGYHVRLRFAGSALVPLITPALKHLTEFPRAGKVDLTICLWDSVSTGARMPPPPWRIEQNGVRGEISGFNSATLRTTYNIGSGILSVLDTSKDVAVYWIRDFAQLPYYESGAPLLTILNWWMSAHQRRILHAGAVGNSKGAVLLVGRGGSGKSSTTLACLSSGLLYLGDDYCMVSSAPIPFVHSIFSSGKVNAEDTRLFPLLDGSLSNAARLGPEKALFFLNARFPQSIVSGLPLRAFLIPKVSGRSETRLVKVSSSASLLALAPSTIFQLPGAGHEVFDGLIGLVRNLPSYVLELGTERGRIPSVITEFLSRW